MVAISPPQSPNGQRIFHERDARIFALLEHVTPILKSYARIYQGGLIYEDLYQEASIIVTRLVDKPFSENDLQRYVYRSVQNRMNDMVRALRRNLASSLEANATLVDTLPATMFYTDPEHLILTIESLEALPDRKRSGVKVQEALLCLKEALA